MLRRYLKHYEKEDLGKGMAEEDAEDFEAK